MVAICVDAGTSVVKAVAFVDNGAEVALARRSVAVLRSHNGWAEQDMHAVWNAVKETIHEVAAQTGSDVSFIAITAQGDGCWLIDEKGAPTGPAALWNDGRANAIVEEWQANGVRERAFRVNGTGAFPGAQSAILRWLHENDSARLDRSATAFYCKDWIVYKLTGVVASEESDSSCPFFDIKARDYAPEMLRIYGEEWAQRLLAPIKPGTQPVGEILPEVARELGIQSGVPIIAAPYDIAATAIGLGAVEPGQAVSILGTTLCNEVVVDAVDTSGTPSGLLICSGLPNRWLRGFATMCGTEALDWICNFIGDIKPSEFTTLAKDVPPGSDGVVFLPYLSPAGERAPFLNANARGTIYGLSLENGRAQLARAVLEGLSFVIRECLAAAPDTPTELNVCGGGALSDIWCQMIADVTNLPVRTTTATEVGAKGAFFVGLLATGRVHTIEEATSKYVQTRKLYQPDASLTERYNSLYDNFLTIRDNAAQAWSLQAQAAHQGQEAQSIGTTASSV